MDQALVSFIVWLVVFGVLTSILWFKGRGRGRGGSRLSFYPFTVILRLGVTLKPNPGRRPARIALWSLVILMTLTMIIFYVEIIYAVYQRYFAPVRVESAVLTPLIPGVTIAWRDVPLILTAVGAGVLVHEAAHAIAARVEGVKVKNAGLALVAFIPAAFVEVDEDDISKASLSTKAKIFSAGVAANLLLALAVAPLIGFFSAGALVLSVDQGSVASAAGISPGDVIVKVNGIPVRDVNSLNEALIRLGFKDAGRVVEFNLTVNRGGAEVTLHVVKPEGYDKLGVVVTTQLAGPGPFLYTLWLINQALALINAAPLFITDGGQLLREALVRVAGKTGLLLSTGIQASTLVLVLSLVGITRIVIPH